MRLTVFGATGGTGRHLVSQAREAGHTITAVVRTEAPDLPDDIEVVRADVLDPTAIEGAIKGRDAVLSAVGIRGRDPAICAPATRSIITAMRATGARRLLVVTAAGHVVGSNDGPLTRRVVKPLVGLILRRNFQDFAETDALVAASGLDWTIMRPPRLTNGPRKPFRTELDNTVRGGNLISRADLAAATLTAAADPATIGHEVAPAY